MIRGKMRVVLVLCLSLGIAAAASAADAPASPQTSLNIAAAANLTDCIKALDAAFVEQHPGVELKVSTGASGNFYAQIKNGAPFDVFVSADVDFPKKLADEGFADPKSLSTYAVGQLVLWTLRDDLDLSQGLAVLSNPSVRRIAIANPQTAPYGRAAQAALSGAGLWDALQGKLAVGETIAQTAQFVQTGNADAGLTAGSLLKSPATLGLGHTWLVPAGTYPPLQQAAVVTQHGADSKLAGEYVKFLTSAKARAIFEAYGYGFPSTP